MTVKFEFKTKKQNENNTVDFDEPAVPVTVGFLPAIRPRRPIWFADPAERIGVEADGADNGSRLRFDPIYRFTRDFTHVQ